MPVQRRVFRIEQDPPVGRPAPLATGRPEAAVLAELQSLRALLEPHAVDRDAVEQARAQIAEAQSYRRELGLIHQAVEQSKPQMTALQTDAQAGDRVARASRELAAIVAGTEKATQSILQAAEEIDQAAAILSAAVKNPQDAELVHDIQDRVVQIFESCNFQDLTGQRVAQVVATLKLVEERTARLLEIWREVEQFTPVVLAEEDDRRFLHGPKLPGDHGHSQQDEIDLIFHRAPRG